MRLLRISLSVAVILASLFLVSTAEARFLSVDPAQTGKVGSSQSWNRYSYVQNNPLNSVDPTGMREAEIYNEAHDVEPGDVVTLVDANNPEAGNYHVVMVAGFTGPMEDGGLPQATIVENVPQDSLEQGLVGHVDSAPHQSEPVNSNSPDLMYNAAGYNVGNVTQNRVVDMSLAPQGAKVGTVRPFTSAEVMSAVSSVGPVTYNWSKGGSQLGTSGDCASYVNRLVSTLNGTATSRTWRWDAIGLSKSVSSW